MPALQIEGGGTMPSPWSDAEILVDQLTPQNLERFPAFAVRVTHHASGRSALLPRVPLPAFAIRIRNAGDRTLLLKGAKAWLSDGTGQRYELLLDRDEIAHRVVDFARGEQPELMQSPVKTAMTDPLDQTPTEALDTAARNTPIFGEGVQIPPRGSWSGAIVLASDARHLETLVRTAKSPRIVLHIEGAHRSSQPMPPFELAFVPHTEQPISVQCVDGRSVDDPKACGVENTMAPIAGGTCVQEGAQPFAGQLVPKAAYINGHSVTRTDVSRVLLDRPESRVHEKRAWALKVAGWVLVGGGAVSTVATAGGLGGAGHSRLAPAGLGMLGISAVGIGLLAGSQREHRLAVQEYNAFAFRAGVCARPL